MKTIIASVEEVGNTDENRKDYYIVTSFTQYLAQLRFLYYVHSRYNHYIIKITDFDVSKLIDENAYWLYQDLIEPKKQLIQIDYSIYKGLMQYIHNASVEQE